MTIALCFAAPFAVLAIVSALALARAAALDERGSDEIDFTLEEWKHPFL